MCVKYGPAFKISFLSLSLSRSLSPPLSVPLFLSFSLSLLSPSPSPSLLPSPSPSLSFPLPLPLPLSLSPHRALGGELFRVIAVDPLPEQKARDVVFQILEGVCHLHSLNIIHMDLKVIARRGGGEGVCEVYLLSLHTGGRETVWGDVRQDQERHLPPPSPLPPLPRPGPLPVGESTGGQV